MLKTFIHVFCHSRCFVFFFLVIFFFLTKISFYLEVSNSLNYLSFAQIHMLMSFWPFFPVLLFCLDKTIFLFLLFENVKQSILALLP